VLGQLNAQQHHGVSGTFRQCVPRLITPYSNLISLTTNHQGLVGAIASLSVFRVFFFIIMGNICGKEKSDNFTSPGRTVSTAPLQNAAPKASVPKKAKVTGPGRTLGSGSGKPAEEQTPDEARRRAAEAAEVRRLPTNP
jgi:hypothetical protein